MQKTPPAFLFYPDNFMGGTMGWDYDQIGRYITLLIMQWNNGPINSKIFRKISGKNSFSILEGKFKKTESGYINERLELEREKCLKSSSKQSQAAKKRWGKTDATALPRHSHGNSTAMPLNLNLNLNKYDDDIKGKPLIAGPPFSTPPPDHLPVPDIVTRLKADEQYLMNLAGAIRKPGLVWKPDWLKLMLDKFEAHLLSEDITHKSLHDFKRHFRDWLKFQPQPQRINNEFY